MYKDVLLFASKVRSIFQEPVSETLKDSAQPKTQEDDSDTAPTNSDAASMETDDTRKVPEQQLDASS